MLTLPEIEQLVMQESIGNAHTSMLLYSMIDQLRHSERDLKNRDQRIKELEEALEVNGVDGMVHHRGLHHALTRAIEDANQYGDTGLLAIIRLENNAHIAQYYGATGAEAAMLHVAQSLQRILRSRDVLAQRDDCSFYILITRQNAEEAVLRLLDVLHQLNSMRVGFTHHHTCLQVGFGTAAYYAQCNADNVLQNAEYALDTCGKTAHTLDVDKLTFI